MSVNTAGSERTNRTESWIQRERHRKSYKNVWKSDFTCTFNWGWKFILCHAIADHNLNYNHTKHLHTPSITAQSVHHVFSCSTCLQLHTILFKHESNPSI